MYQDFCDRCGSAIDPKTGRCPNCAQRRSHAGWIVLAVVLIAAALAWVCFRAPIARGVSELTRRAEDLFAPAPETEPVRPETPVPEDEAEAPLDNRAEIVKAAQSYLDSQLLTPSDLYLLLYEDGYAEADIDYALDNCGADWYEAAAYIAMDEVANYYYSRAMLVETLESCGFTEDEAAYGADYCGADWAEEAALYGAFLLADNPDLPADELCAQLLAFGYTEEEAQYALEQLSDSSPTL